MEQGRRLDDSAKGELFGDGIFGSDIVVLGVSQRLGWHGGTLAQVSLMLPFWMMLPNIRLSLPMRARKSAGLR